MGKEKFYRIEVYDTFGQIIKTFHYKTREEAMAKGREIIKKYHKNRPYYNEKSLLYDLEIWENQQMVDELITLFECDFDS